ncbi:aldo/keto reductase [Streptomyces sp. QHH-9511]|uniref:aldo/keto reductase n=1 Tax=Streptomyces sp. QHH-9511 TaxID=2684468 RepID=UPI0022B7BF3F|nr:aldo/keto reductase [Streptomyces sp. QHH-9511]
MGMSAHYGASDDAESLATIDRALELGVTLLDTAEGYGPFRNEQLLGKALAGRREAAVVATKTGVEVTDEGVLLGFNGTPEYMERRLLDGVTSCRQEPGPGRPRRAPDGHPRHGRRGRMPDDARPVSGRRLDTRDKTMRSYDAVQAESPTCSLSSATTTFGYGPGPPISWPGSPRSPRQRFPCSSPSPDKSLIPSPWAPPSPRAPPSSPGASSERELVSAEAPVQGSGKQALGGTADVPRNHRPDGGLGWSRGGLTCNRRTRTREVALGGRERIGRRDRPAFRARARVEGVDDDA